MEIQFDFCVTGFDAAESERLFRLIVHYVEENGGFVGGGFRPVEVEGDKSQERAGVSVSE